MTRVSDPADARAVLISLTDAGRELLTDVRRERAAVLAPYVDGLDEEQRARLVEAVATLNDVLQAAPTAAETALAQKKENR